MSRNSALTARARRYLADAGHAFNHAPVEVTLSVLLAAAFSYTVASDAEPFRDWLELAIIIVLTGAAAFSATLLHALGAFGSRTRWAITGAGAAVAALYGVTVLDLSLAAEAWRAALLVAGAALLVLAAPSLAGSRSSLGDVDATERFRSVTGRVLMRTLAVLLYAAALYAGLALALGAVNTLFELRLDARIYAHTLGWVFFVLVTWVIVGGVPDYVRPGSDAGPVAAAVHRISAFLVTPLLAIYYIILYAYAVRIALTGELPKNLVSPLVIAAGLIAGIALVLFDRARAAAPTAGAHAAMHSGEPATAHSGARAATHSGEPATAHSGDVAPAIGGAAAGSFRSLRIAAPLFIPLCVLGIWAIGMRLGQYGWTEFRAVRLVVLVALGALAIAAAAQVLRRRSLSMHVLPLTLAAVAVLSAIGPWSLMAVSRRSQQARLAEAMSAAGLEWNVAAVTDTIVPSEPFREISETARYLASHHGADALPPLFAVHVQGDQHVDVVYEAGLRSERPDLTPTRGAYGQLASGSAIGVGSLYYVRLDVPAIRAQIGSTSEPEVRPDTAPPARAAGSPVADPYTVRIPVGGLVLLADLTPVAVALLADPSGAPRLSADNSRVPLHDERGIERGELFVLEIGIGGGEGLNIYQLEGVARLTLPR